MNRTPIRSSRPRSAFTLVELLVVIAVIALLSAIGFGTYQKAMNTAKEARTRQLIIKLDDAMRSKWESYRTRRIPLEMVYMGSINEMEPIQIFAARKLNAVRDIQRMELPDSWRDVTTNPVVTGVSRPALSQLYKTLYDNNTVNGTPVTPSTKHQSAECLYLIMTMGQGRDNISVSELARDQVGDVDNDGMKEFLDGWGRPIRFLRWAPGFVSELQLLDEDTGEFDVVRNHDPFDSRMVDPGAYALYPLIFSAGNDGIYDIEVGSTGFVNVSSGNIPIKCGTSTGTRTFNFNFRPYPYAGATQDRIGRQKNIVEYVDMKGTSTTTFSNSTFDFYDNIHNHMPRTR